MELLVWCCLLQLVTQEQIDAARAGLSSKAAGDAEAAYEAEKARVGEARRAELEAQLAVAAEAAAAAAAEAEVRLTRLWLTCVVDGTHTRNDNLSQLEAACMADGQHTVRVAAIDPGLSIATV
jgi:hypothetical protein